MKNSTDINVYWEGPFTYQDIEDGLDSEKYDIKSEDIGLYQVYGYHPLYGNDVLLYIGRTKDSFKSRLKNRWIIEGGNDTENIKIYLGTILSYSEVLTDYDIKLNIEKAEVLLINTLKPAFNSSNIQSADPKLLNENYILNNVNNYRSLYPVLSSEYFWKENLNFIRVDELSKGKNVEMISDDSDYGFNLPENENIFIGVDGEIWTTCNIPLVIGINKKSVVNKKIIEKEFKILPDKEPYECYYMSACENLNDDDAIEQIESKIKEVVNLLKE